VPYFIGGIGPSWVQSKDVFDDGRAAEAEVEGYTYTVTAGGGFEYFLRDNVSFDVQGRYNWVQPVDGTAYGQTKSADFRRPCSRSSAGVFRRKQPHAAGEPRTGADFPPVLRGPRRNGFFDGWPVGARS